MPFVVAHCVALLGLMSITNAKMVGSPCFIPAAGDNTIEIKQIYEMDLPYKITSFLIFHVSFSFSSVIAN